MTALHNGTVSPEEEQRWAEMPMTAAQKGFLQHLMGSEAVAEQFGGLSKGAASVLIDTLIDEPRARRERQQHVRFLFSLAARLAANRWSKHEDLLASPEAQKAFIREVHHLYDLLKEAEATLPDAALAETL